MSPILQHHISLPGKAYRLSAHINPIVATYAGLCNTFRNSHIAGSSTLLYPPTSPPVPTRP